MHSSSRPVAQGEAAFEDAQAGGLSRKSRDAWTLHVCALRQGSVTQRDFGSYIYDTRAAVCQARDWWKRHLCTLWQASVAKGGRESHINDARAGVYRALGSHIHGRWVSDLWRSGIFICQWHGPVAQKNLGRNLFSGATFMKAQAEGLWRKESWKSYLWALWQGPVVQPSL